MKLTTRIYLHRLFHLSIWGGATIFIINLCDLTFWPVALCLAITSWQFLEHLFLTYKAFKLIRHPMFFILLLEDFAKNAPPRKTSWNINGKSIKEVPGTYKEEELKMYVTFPPSHQ